MKKGHAIDLTQKAIDEKADVVVACGGDGTINEVARGFVETEVPLGIIPLGSEMVSPVILKFHSKFLNQSKSSKKISLPKWMREWSTGIIFLEIWVALGITFYPELPEEPDGMVSGPMSLPFLTLWRVLSIKKSKLNTLEIRQISPFVLLVSNTNQQGYNFSLTPPSPY